MSYNPAIPAPTDLISNSQPQLLANFAQLDAQYSADHDGLVTTNESGMHNQVTFLADQAAPSLTRNGVAGVSGLYTNTDGTNSQLFFQNATGSIPITGLLSAGANGWATLPGGIVIQWGFAASAADGATIAFPSATAFTTACYNVQLTGGRSSTTVHSLYVRTGTITQTNFQIRCDVSQDVYFFAIGK